MSARQAGDEQFVIVGRVRKAHGIHGELVVEPITDEPDAFFAPGRRVFAGTATGDLAADRGELHIVRTTPFKDGLIVAFREIVDRTAAELWGRRYLLVPSTEVAPPAGDELFVHELLGMRVRLVSGETLGEVADVFELPQGLALDVARADRNGTVMLLYGQSVRAVDRATRTIDVEVPEGMLD
jgi:16S rRNA processing protein RimM